MTRPSDFRADPGRKRHHEIFFFFLLLGEVYITGCRYIAKLEMYYGGSGEARIYSRILLDGARLLA